MVERYVSKKWLVRCKNFSKLACFFLIPVISSTSSSDEDEEVGDDSDRELAQPPDAVKSGPERIHVRLWEEKHWVKGRYTQ